MLNLCIFHTLAGGGDSINLVVNAITKYSPVGDKIFSLWAGTVMTPHTVVLVWFTSILSEYAHALMIAEDIELKQLFNLNSYPFTD